MATKTVKLFLRTVLPVLIGLAVTAWLFHDEFSASNFDDFVINGRMIAGFAIAWLFMAGRDFGLTWRFHTIASPTLTWRRALRVDLMCAFTSAITPSAMGGSAFAIFYLNREKVSLGRATTLTLTTLFLDEMFFVVFCPIIMLVLPIDQLFATASGGALDNGIALIFWLVYAGIVIWTGILFMGIIVKPKPVSRFIKRMFMAKKLRRWRSSAFSTANNMVHASKDLRKCDYRWWLNVFGATVVSWFSRYLVVNALFWGFAPDASGLLIFGRQFVVWVLLMISPTPGGSGVSEWLFTEYYGDLLPAASMAVILALTWRVVSYYIYIFLGSILVPTYFGKGKSNE
jgi:uncharacterized protein (TIRG00374 family)